MNIDAVAAGEAFERHGVLSVPHLVEDDVVAVFKTDLQTRIRNAYDAGQRITAFDKLTGDHDRDPLFLDSGASAVVIHEPLALAWKAKPNWEEYESAVARVGHGLHAIAGPVADWLRAGPLAEITRATGLRHPQVIETMYVRKSRWAEALPLHIDHSYLWTTPPTVQVVWLALDPAGPMNGGLVVSDEGRVRADTRLVRAADEASVVQLAPVEEAWRAKAIRTRNVTCEVGDAVVVDGLVPHGSGPGSARTTRDVLAVHVVDGDADWAQTNYLGNATPLTL